MKKSAFIFAVFYFLSVVGYGLELHYCLGQITDVNIAWLDTSCCCDDEQNAVAAPCCDEKEFFVQLSEKHQASNGAVAINCTPVQLFEIAFNNLESTENLSKTYTRPQTTGPPLKIPLFEQYCARVIYS